MLGTIFKLIRRHTLKSATTTTKTKDAPSWQESTWKPQTQ